MLLKKTDSCIIIENLIYFLILKLNNESSSNQYQNILNNFKIYCNISDYESIMTDTSLNKIYNDNKFIEHQNKKLNEKISINNFINIIILNSNFCFILLYFNHSSFF